MSTIDLSGPVRQVVELLVARRYSQLGRLTSSGGLSPCEIEDAFRQYGATPVAPPPEAYRELDVVCVHSAPKPTWSVHMPVWTQEEGRSDLTIEMTVIREGDRFVIGLDGIHVL